MYCEERKQGFIRYCTELGADTQYQKKIRLLFNHTEEFEKSEGVELLDMTSEQVSRLADSGSLGKTRVCTALCVLRSYMKWFVFHEGLTPGGNGVVSYYPDGLEDTRLHMVSGDQHLNNVLNMIFPPEDENGTTNLVRAFIWLSYAGAYEDEILRLTKQNFDLRTLTVRIDGKELKLSSYALKSLLFAVTSDTFSVNHPQYSQRKRAEGDSIMRGTKSVLKSKDIRNRIITAQKEAAASGKPPVDFTPYDIFKSGRFSDMLSAERDGVFPDFSLDVIDFMNHQTKAFGKLYMNYGESSIESNKRMLKATFLEDYSRWKLAFSYA